MSKKEQKKTLSEQEREAYALVGRHGGRATFKKHGREHMKEIAKRGANKRWQKKVDKSK